ncbi:MAG: hypothetical protein IPH44_29870 [Myxococcales bacterium]|nr:hypothetical protein [Myxococcales bacterium]MBK7194926.1 hypothetical protein [Myxococcales bacterium]MBP6846419.1 hypothetical protein [Kofleriaceae bacterium]
MACGPGYGPGTGTGPSGGGGEGPGFVGGPCLAKDQCHKGGACNLGTQICDEVSTAQCGTIGSDCCPPSSASGPCGLGGSCEGAICQPCGHKGQVCCPGFNIAECTCEPGLTSTGVDCQ